MALHIPEISKEEWAGRMFGVHPPDWSGEAAKAPGGRLYGLFTASGQPLANEILPQLDYVLKACRIATAEGEALDLVALDFFGTDIERTPGEPDTSLRNRIVSSLLLPAGTRPAMEMLIERLVGRKPRIIEPWSPADCGAWDGVGISHYDVETPEYPFRWADPGLRYQAGVESPLPPYSGQLNNPIYGYDSGMGWDVPGWAYADPDPTWFLTIRKLDALINRVKTFGTIVWRKFQELALATQKIPGYLKIAVGATKKNVQVFPVFGGPYTVMVRTNWNTTVSIVIVDNNEFDIVFGTPAPGDADLDFIACPITMPGTGIGAVTYEASEVTIAIPTGYTASQVIITPNWNTTSWIHSFTGNTVTFRFGVPAPFEARVDFLFFPSYGVEMIPVGDVAISIAVPGVDPFQAFAIPNWDTTVVLHKSDGLLSASFGTPAPADAKLNWVINQQVLVA